MNQLGHHVVRITTRPFLLFLILCTIISTPSQALDVSSQQQPKQRTSATITQSLPFLSKIRSSQAIAGNVTSCLISTLQAVNYKNYARKSLLFLQQKAPFVLQETQNIAKNGKNVVSITIKEYLSQRRSSSPFLAKCRVIGGLLGIIFSLTLTGPFCLRWWTDVCLKENVTSCGSILTGSLSLGWGLGREFGLLFYYFMSSRL